MPTAPGFSRLLYLSVSPAASATSALLQKDLKWMTLSSSKDCVGRRGGGRGEQNVQTGASLPGWPCGHLVQMSLE